MKVYLATILLIPCYTIGYCQLSNPILIHESDGLILESRYQHINGDDEIDAVYLLSNKNDGGALYQAIGERVNGNFTFISSIITDKKYNKTISINIDDDNELELLAIKTDATLNCQELDVYDFNGTIYTLLEDHQTLFDTLCNSNISAADINGNGRDDIIVSTKINSQNSEFDVFYTTDDGSNYYEGILPVEGVIRKIADVNQDGQSEIFISDHFKKELYMLSYNSNNDFETTIIDSNFSFVNKELHIQNIDNDETLEILIEDEGLDTMYAMDFISPSEVTQIRPIFYCPFGGDHWIDIDFDGHIDHYKSNNELISINDGNGNFYQVENTKEIDLLYHAYTKVDYDNKIAEYYRTSDLSTLQITINNDNEWSQDVLNLGHLFISSIDDIELTDITGDGIEDLIYCSRWGHAVGYFKGMPDKSFSTNHVIADEEGAYDVSTGDMNGDGIIDVIYSGIWSGNLWVIYGNGDGTFNNKQKLVDNWGLVRGSAIADFAKDGFPDIVVSSITTDILGYIKNINGEFQNIEIIGSGNGPENIKIYDVNQDGYPDIINNQYQGNLIENTVQYINDGSGNLNYQGVWLNTNSSDIHFTDMDGDRVNEIFSHENGVVTIHKNINGILQPWREVNIENTQTNVILWAIDYDGDEYKDIMVLKSFSNEIDIYKNINNDNWTYVGTYLELLNQNIAPFDLNGIFVGDLDQDFDSDLLFVTEDNKLYRIVDQIFDPAIEGYTYWDENQDSLYTNTEKTISSVEIIATNTNNNSIKTYSDDNGHYRLFTPDGQYQLDAIPPSECWQAQFENIEVESNQDSSIQVNFGFDNLFNGAQNISVNISRAVMRCNTPVKHYVTVENTSCQPITGILTYHVDNLIDTINQISLIDYKLEDNKIIIDDLDLLPGETLKFNFKVSIPGVELINTSLQDSLVIYYDDLNNNELSEKYIQTISDNIRCAYDPNDKLASPDRSDIYDESYVTDEEIFYTIRFQNTGNDTAFNVKLLDTLSNVLDINTFRPVNASHPYEIRLDTDTRELRIDFRNILLPDSTTNQVESNGFFTFRISPIANLTEFAEITNRASIYFDLNPPILTNTTENIYVSDFSILETDVIESTIAPTIIIHPNPTYSSLNIQLSKGYIEGISIMSLDGKILFNNNPSNTVDVSELINGMYIIHIKHSYGTFVSKFCKY